MFSLFMPEAIAAVGGGAGIYCGDSAWYDTNPNNVLTISACQEFEVGASAGMGICTFDPIAPYGHIDGTVSASASGGLEADQIDSGPGWADWNIKVKDPTKPGKVFITATVTGPFPGNDCDSTTIEATATVIYDPNGGSCSSCNSSPKKGPFSGSGSVDNSSVEFRLNLGRSSPAYDGGYLWLDADTPSTNLCQPTSLQIPFIYPNVAVVSNLDGSIAQVLSPQGLVNVSVVNPYQYQLQCFYATNVTAMTGSLYTTTGSTYDTWVVQNPDTNAADNRLWITEEPATGVNRQFQFTYNPTNMEWDLLQPDGQTTITTWKIPDSGDPTITNRYRQVSVGGSVVSASCKTYQYIAALDKNLLLQEVSGTGASAQTNTYTYYTSGYASNLLQQVNYANGNWKYYTYDIYGRVTNEFSAYNNSAPPTSGAPDPLVNHCRLTTYTYDVATIDSNSISGEDAFNSRWTTNWIPVQGMSGWALHAVSSQYNFLGAGSSYMQQYVNPGVDATELETTTFLTTNYFGVQSPYLITRPDGTSVFYDYIDQYTTVETDPDGSQTTNIVDELGNPMLITKINTDTGVVLSQLTYTYTNSAGVYYDQLRHSYDVKDLAGRVTQYRYNDCCASYTVTDPDGNVTQYADDLLKRPVARTVLYGGVNGITTTNILDGAGRALITQRIGTDGTVITMQQSQYDLLGNVIRQTNALGGVTISTNVIINNQLYVTNTYPDGGTRIETYYSDGRLQSVTGTAVHPVEYIYGVEQDTDGTWREYTQEIKLTATGGTNEWTKTYVDGVGHPYKTIYSSASGTPASQSYYNEYGQLWKQVDPDGVTTLYYYSTEGSDSEYGNINQGRLEYTVTALSGTALSYTDYDDFYAGLSSLEGGIDRIQKVEAAVIPAAGAKPDLVQYDTYVWTNGETDTTGTLVSIQQTSTDGLQAWKITYGDLSKSVTNYSVITPGTSRTEVAAATDNSYVINTFSYGRLASSTRYDSASTQIGGTTYGYDAQGRQNTMTDARNGTTTLGFDNADLVTTNTTPNPGGGSPEVTITSYNNMLQATGMTQPDGTTVNSSYLLTGELGLQYGSRTYPVGYSYDYAGRMQTMTNWSGGLGGAGARVTTWNYDIYRGFLTNKVYDGGAAGPSYTYTPAGRLASRIWARGITTSYGYDGAGGLTNVSYSDGVTPGVTNNYDRLGRVSTIICNGMTNTLAYNLANQLLNESFSGGVLNGLSVTNGYDQYLRRTNLTALASSVLSQTIYGYDNASRLASDSDGNNDTATYNYLANSMLVSNITFKQSGTTRMTNTKTYDYLNRLTQISSAPSSGLASTFNYSYNAANQRTHNTLADGSYWVYGYDSLGQVTNACKYFADGTPVAGQQFDYTFDTIGNRTQTQAGGDSTGANLRTANYTNNTLNQITSRDVPAYVDVMGASILSNTVSVNGSTAYRKEEYYRQQIPANNSSSALWTNIIVSGGLNVTGNVYVAKTPEIFSYDADGNLTNDGRWIYIWDGENRLKGMAVNTNVGPQYQLSFAYDAKGRRIQKIVTTNGVAYSTNNFLYDGWNLIAETRPDNSLIRSYVWGTDLSGTSQGAGGVGGLLEISYHGSSITNCFPAYDGNGNIAAIINAADGTVTANYDYAAFGEQIRITGTMAKNNPFRFSTKYDDDESDLIYYGNRFYKPSAGSWLNQDPIQEWGGYNLFEFVANDPINSADILGLWQATCTAGDGLGGKLTVGKNSGQWNGGAYGGPTAGFSLNLDLKDSGTHTPGWSPGAQADVNLGKNFSGSASVDGDGSSVDLSHPFGKSPLSGSMGSDGPGASLSLGESESAVAGASYYSGSTPPASPPVQAYHGTDGSLYVGPPGTQPLDHGFPQQPTPYSGGGQNLVQNASPPGCGCH
jgi:RHS repeat-associated protein